MFSNITFTDNTRLDWLYVRDIITDSENSVWIATSNYGIIHIQGDIQHPSTLKYSNYSFYNGALTTNNVLCLYEDKAGCLWAGTEGGGLYLYDRKMTALMGKSGI